MITLNVFMFLLVLSNGYYHQITIITNNNNDNNKQLNHTQIIDQYLDDIHDNIVILPSIYDTNNICKELQSLLINQPNLTPPQIGYILFIHSFQPFIINQCMDFRIISDSVINNDSLRIINLKWNYWNTYNRVNSRHLLNTNNYSGWISPSDPLLPRPDNSIASSSYNNTIYLFGGWNYRRQFVEFNTISHTFIDHGVSSLNIDVYGVGQYYTQQNNEMYYWIDGDSGNKIIIYHLSTQSIVQNISIPNNVGIESCLASSQDLLFVLGGYYNNNVLRTSQIYNISSQIWLSGVPSMISSRRRMSCIVHPTYNMVYAIAGTDVDSVENIQINDILNNDWQNIGNLDKRYSITRSIIHEDSVIVFGGDCSGCDVSTKIFIINGKTNEITFGGNLDYGVAATSAILVNQNIYLFGGWNPDISKIQDDTLDKWQYLHFIVTTSSPTNNPTTTTTSAPTNNPTTTTTSTPTTYPTTYPTTDPTLYPTTDPTLYPTAPTKYPTVDPTIYPTIHPTIHPTTDPSVYPTIDPTIYPSINPTVYPTIDPTINPTKIPSKTPTVYQPDGEVADNTVASSTTIDNYTNMDNEENENILFIVIGAMSVCIMSIICFVVFKMHRRKQVDKQLSDDSPGINMTRIITVSSATQIESNNVLTNTDHMDIDEHIENSVEMLFHNVGTSGNETKGNGNIDGIENMKTPIGNDTDNGYSTHIAEKTEGENDGTKADENCEDMYDEPIHGVTATGGNN